MRVLLGAFGDPGHAFPMIALGRALVARGHDVTLQTWGRWEGDVRAEGMTFAAAPEYTLLRSGVNRDGSGLYDSVPQATTDTLPLVRSLRPDVAVADILTLAPALAAEIEGVPWATLIPHIYPDSEPDFPIYSIGARLPRTATGRWLWRHGQRPARHGLEIGRRELNGARAELGLAPLTHPHGGISRKLALVATFPQLEYPRAWPDHVHVVGPLMWEPPAEEVKLPSGGPGGERDEAPLVLVAPSTAQDPGHRLLAATLQGLADADVR
ncbi:MAG TPA: glycosyl transferase, partial [Solirubrobacteraceae bacterium]|nr:glycosyl transferase [Solirubrobacteraceae bacterium]